MEATVNATDALLNTGIMGAVFVFVTVPLAIYAYRLSKALSSVQEKRIDDAKSITAELLKLSTTFNQTTTAQIVATEAQKTSLQNLKEVCDRLCEKVEKIAERM